MTEAGNFCQDKVNFVTDSATEAEFWCIRSNMGEQMSLTLFVRNITKTYLPAGKISAAAQSEVHKTNHAG
jgi:hypothetical protein